MYGGILALDGAVTDPGLGISLPGRYQLQQVDEQTVKGQVINYSGCEDNDFAFTSSCVLKQLFMRLKGNYQEKMALW